MHFCYKLYKTLGSTTEKLYKDRLGLVDAFTKNSILTYLLSKISLLIDIMFQPWFKWYNTESMY